jgi:hypothetical protein
MITTIALIVIALLLAVDDLFSSTKNLPGVTDPEKTRSHGPAMSHRSPSKKWDILTIAFQSASVSFSASFPPCVPNVRNGTRHILSPDQATDTQNTAA